jgi:hypothetical protein
MTTPAALEIIDFKSRDNLWYGFFKKTASFRSQLVTIALHFLASRKKNKTAREHMKKYNVFTNVLVVTLRWATETNSQKAKMLPNRIYDADIQVNGHSHEKRTALVWGARRPLIGRMPTQRAIVNTTAVD